MKKHIHYFRVHLLILILITANAISFSQSISRAFRNYEEGDLPKAFELFSKGVKSDTSNTSFNFGMALVFSNPKFDKKNYFLAWKYLQVADANFINLSPDDTKDLAEFLFNLEPRKTNKTVRQKFDIHKKAIEDKLIKYVREENDMDMIDSFINEFPNSMFYENVIHIRNYIAYSKVASENTLDGFNGFINKYPEAAQISEAIAKRNQLAFSQAKASGKLEDMISFLALYPNADQKLDAIKLRNEIAFQQAKKTNTIAAYDLFVHSYPDAVQVSTALKLQKQLVFEKAKSINTFEAYSEFIRKYPEAEQYVDVFNLMANSLGDAVSKELNLSIPGLDWIKAFDNYGKNDLASALCPFADGTFALAGTTTDDSLNVSQGWFVKFGIDWKMSWAKNYGNRLGISLSSAVSTASGDIFAGGYAMKNPMVRDSSAWYIKLNSQGLKYFDKEAEANAIQSISAAPGDLLVFSGFHADTAGRPHYWLMEGKETGKKLWSRIYTGLGNVTNIKADPQGKIYASCGRWVFKTDVDGYIQWEFTPEKGDSILSLDLSKTGELFMAGVNNLQQLILVKLSNAGKQVARYIIPSISSVTQIAAMKITPINEILIALNTATGPVFEKLNDKGQVLTDIKINSTSTSIKDLALTTDGGKLLLLENLRKQTGWDIVLIKLK